MRAKEFIVEQHTSLQAEVAAALPATYAIPALQNQDPYKQYRFGVALAATKNRIHRPEHPSEPPLQHMEPRSAWGENMVVVSYDPNIGDWIDAALAEVGLNAKDKKMLSTPTSDERKDAGVVSPVKPFRGYPR
jgi:hypothetical protein